MGRHAWSTRLTTDQTFTLGLKDLKRGGLFAFPAGTRFTLTMPNPRFGASKVMTTWREINCRLGGEVLWVRDQLPSKLGPQTVAVVKTPCHFGGFRHWFKCGCGRRAAFLYLLSPDTPFACRHCWNLTYKSCRKHDPRVSSLIKGGVRAIKRGLENPSHSLKLASIEAFLHFLHKPKSRRWNSL
jgi:hypothetical protein